MRRALIASAGTVVGLAALLSYKSAGPVNPQRASLGSSGPSVPTKTTTAPSATATYTGQDVPYNYGDIEVAVAIEGGKIASVTVPQNNAIDGRSQVINSYAVPVLEQEALAAQGTNINVVSGATFTSDAFAQSLQSALQKAGQ